MNTVGVDMQPCDGCHPEYALYFVAVILLGSWFKMNIFVGVLVEQFSEVKQANGGASVLLTPPRSALRSMP